jgi:hypothetical protein
LDLQRSLTGGSPAVDGDFYLMVVVVGCLWATDAVLTGVLRINKDAIQWTLLAAALYGIVQIMPFGSLAETAGISGIPRHISIDPFWTQVAALHFFAYFVFSPRF